MKQVNALVNFELTLYSEILSLLINSIPFGIVNTCALGLVWSYCLHQPDESVVPHYHWAVISYAVAALIELSSEPVYIVSQILLFVRMKVCLHRITGIVFRTNEGMFYIICINVSKYYADCHA